MRSLVLVIFSLLLAASAPAQSFFGTPNTYLTPGWRGSTGEYSRWDVFYSPYNGINYPDIAAPNGTGSFASDAGALAPANANPTDPYAFWNAANPTLTQTGTDSAFIIGAGTAGNIYSFSAATGYVIADSTPYNAGTVVMQFQTDGQLLDLSSIRLVGSNGISYTPTNFITEYKSSGSSFGGLTNRTAAQWNLTGLGLSSYTIRFAATGSSNSFQELLLDTAPAYTEAVPSARTWNAASGSWSEAGKWSGGMLPATGGNLLLTSGSQLTVDNTTRTIGELRLSAANSFTIDTAHGGVLKLNTGLTASPAAASTYTINTPVQMGSYNLWNAGANADVVINGEVSGNTGFDQSGAGTVRLKGDNTFTGSVTLDGGGTLELSGTNAYTGNTNIAAGTLVIKGAAPATGGVLGSTTALNVGGGGTFGSAPARVIIDGPWTVAQAITGQAGADGQVYGARNTGAGATFAGALTLNSAASQVQFSAESATDVLTFSGTVSGGGAGGTVAKTGAGKVIFAGGTKSYLNDTTVQVGTLELASGTTFSGNGKVTVGAGAKLLVQGTLSGTGPLALQGGTIGGSGTINRTFALAAGDTLAPGNGVGTLNSVGQTWGAGGKFQLELSDAAGSAGTGWDLDNLTGALSLTAAAAGFTLELHTLSGTAAGAMAGFNPQSSYAWRIASASSGVTGFSASAFKVDDSAFLNAHTGSFSVAKSGNDVLLVYTAPEPGCALLLACGATLGLGARRRFCRRH